MNKIGKRHLRRQVSFLVERQVRKMADALETMEYRFSIISSYHGNTYILDELQRRVSKAIGEVQEGTATDIYAQANGPAKTIQEKRTKGTGWKIKRREYWLEDKYWYWSDEALAEVGLTRAERPLEKILLEKMEYKFSIVSSIRGNDYILDVVQRWGEQAMNEVRAGNAIELGTPVTGTNKKIDCNETHTEKWNVRRYSPDYNEEGGEE